MARSNTKAQTVDVKCDHNPPFDMDNIINVNVAGKSVWITLCDDCMYVMGQQRVLNAITHTRSGQEIKGCAR